MRKRVNRHHEGGDIDATLAADEVARSRHAGLVSWLVLRAPARA